MSEKKVKRLMISVIIFLPLQYAVVGIVGVIKSEPWPALILPAFKSVFSKPDKIAINQVKFYVQDNKNEKIKEIQPQKLFNKIPESQLQGFLRTYFLKASTMSNFSQETRSWLKNRIFEYDTSFVTDHLYIKWIQSDIFDTRSMAIKDSSRMIKHFSIAL